MTRKAGQARPNHLLRAARKKQDWTQQFVADQIGAPLALNVTRWERGTSIPSLHYAQRLCQLFGMSPQELGLLPIEDEIQYPYPPSPHWNVPYPRNPFLLDAKTYLHIWKIISQPDAP